MAKEIKLLALQTACKDPPVLRQLLGQSPPRSTPHEADTLALERQLEGTRITRKGDPYPQITTSPSKMVTGGRQCASK